MASRNLGGTLVLSAPPSCPISGPADAGRTWGSATANLPEVASQAARSAGQLPAIWAEAAVSIPFRAQMCQTSHLSSAVCQPRQLIAPPPWKRRAGHCERASGDSRAPAVITAHKARECRGWDRAATSSGRRLCQVDTTQGHTDAGNAVTCDSGVSLCLPGRWAVLCANQRNQNHTSRMNVRLGSVL